jgi:predicted nucleotidyltransferase
MTYRKREILRRPSAMVRTNEKEESELDILIDYYGGVSKSEAFRLALLEIAREKRHEANSLAPRRLQQTVDENAFSCLRAA